MKTNEGMPVGIPSLIFRWIQRFIAMADTTANLCVFLRI